MHDNASPHVSKNTLQKLEELGWEVLAHPPYSPDLAPSDYHIFRSLKQYLQGKKFKSLNDIKFALNDYFDSKPTSWFKKGIDDLIIRWRNVIDNNGEYYDD